MSDNPSQSPTAAPPPPGAALDPFEAHQDDIALTQPTGMVKAAAILVVVSGLIAALVGIQLLVSVTIVHRLLRLVPYALLVAGFGAGFLGWKTMKTRGWAAIGSAAIGGLLTLGMGYWVLLSTAAGFISLLALLLPPLALIATVFAGLAIGPCRRADAARRRLAEAGVDMSF